MMGKSNSGSEREIFGEMTKSLLFITGKQKDLPKPQYIKGFLAKTACVAASTCAPNAPHQPLQHCKAEFIKELATKTKAPRTEDQSRYSMSNDKGKSQLNMEDDRNHQKYKYEHKAAM